jgi:hypothetical protein
LIGAPGWHLTHIIAFMRSLTHRALVAMVLLLLWTLMVMVGRAAAAAVVSVGWLMGC